MNSEDRSKQLPTTTSSTRDLIEVEVVEPEDQKTSDAAQQLATLIEQGVRKAIREEKRAGSTKAGITFGELFSIYMTEYARLQCKTWKNMERTFKNDLWTLRNRDAGLITRMEIQTLFNQIPRKTTANRALELLVMVFNKAVEWELLSVNPGARIKKHRLAPRERFIQADEFPRWFQAVNSLRYEVARDLFLMLLFTGQRRGEVMMMRWDSVDMKRGVWYLKETKNGTSHVLPLLPEALAIVIARNENKVNEWVFNSTGPTGRYRKPENAWGEVLRRSGITNLRIHDLRRSHLSWQAITGANVSAIAATANHKDLASTAIYARLNDKAVRDAMGNSVDAMLSAAGIQLPRAEREKQPSAGLTTLLPSIDGEWVSEKEAATILEVPRTTLENWRRNKTAPVYMVRGWNILYHSPSLRLFSHGRTEKEPRSRKEAKADPNKPGKLRRRPAKQIDEIKTGDFSQLWEY